MKELPDLLGARRLRELLARHGLTPSRALGQNFVIDPNTIRKVVSVSSPDPEERVLEIGPGVGSLTLGLAEAAGQVIAIERDGRLLPVLEETVGGLSNVEVVHGDALDADLASFGAASLVANLPYNIAATVVLDALERAPGIRVLTVMVQREVGERLSAQVGSAAYGATSVLVAFFGTARVATTISRSAFWPAPNVDSVLLRIERKDRPPPVDAQAFFRVVKAAFGQRRKTLRNALGELAGSPAAAEDRLRAAGVDPGARAETLGLDAYVDLCRALADG